MLDVAACRLSGIGNSVSEQVPPARGDSHSFITEASAQWSPNTLRELSERDHFRKLERQHHSYCDKDQIAKAIVGQSRCSMWGIQQLTFSTWLPCCCCQQVQ